MSQGNKIYSGEGTFTISLPAGGLSPDTAQDHWERCSEVLRNAAPAHALHGHFWCREASPASPSARVARSVGPQGGWKQFYPALRSRDVGFRPVLRLPEGHGARTGDILRRFTLTMDGRVTYFNLQQKHAPRHYRPGAALRIVDSYRDQRVLIPWVVVGDHAIAAENLLVNVSWNDLCAQGFVPELQAE